MFWYTRPDLSQTVSMVSRYMPDPRRGHWEAVKWILRYIKGKIDVRLVLEKDSNDKQDCVCWLWLCMRPWQAPVYDGICLHIILNTNELALDFVVYCSFVNRSWVYDYDRGYKGGHLASRFTWWFGDQAWLVDDQLWQHKCYLFGEEPGLSCTDEAHQCRVSFCWRVSRRRWSSAWLDSHIEEFDRHAYQGGFGS